MALLDAGIHIGAGAPGYVNFFTTVNGQKLSATAVVVTRVRSIGPSEIDGLELVSPSDHVVLVAPTLSEPVREFIEGRGWSWLATPRDGRPVTGRLQFKGWSPVEIGQRHEDSELPAARRGKRPWGQFAIIRQLLRGGDWTQTELARSSGVSQPRVSQVLADLTRDQLVGRFMGGRGDQFPRWQTNDSSELLHRWLDTYPGPGGLATYWYSLDPIADQARLAIKALERARSEGLLGDPVVSGDAASDFIAPYRRSQFGVVYSHWGVDLEEVGFTPTVPGEATLHLVVPDDWSIWPPPGDAAVRQLAPAAPFPIADPVQVIWDLLHGPATDADQAAQGVERALRNLAMHRQIP